MKKKSFAFLPISFQGTEKSVCFPKTTGTDNCSWGAGSQDSLEFGFQRQMDIRQEGNPSAAGAHRQSIHEQPCVAPVLLGKH